jgi:hypothetical protein
VWVELDYTLAAGVQPAAARAFRSFGNALPLPENSGAAEPIGRAAAVSIAFGDRNLVCNLV